MAFPFCFAHWKQSKQKSGEDIETRLKLALGAHQYNKHAYWRLLRLLSEIWQKCNLVYAHVFQHTFTVLKVVVQEHNGALFSRIVVMTSWMKVNSKVSYITSAVIMMALLAAMSDQKSTGWFLANSEMPSSIDLSCMISAYTCTEYTVVLCNGLNKILSCLHSYGCNRFTETTVKLKCVVPTLTYAWWSPENTVIIWILCPKYHEKWKHRRWVLCISKKGKIYSRNAQAT